MSKELTPTEMEALLATLQQRFLANMNRHSGIDWQEVQKKLEINTDKLLIINQMELSGGMPDVVVIDGGGDAYTFVDCSPETPIGRRSYCYDPEALASRKENKPANSAVGVARVMGIELLTEQQYRALQQLGKFDLKTSSWIQTPTEIRQLGGALFCDRRYNTVFTYHNGAESYYAARGFRGKLVV